MPRQISYRDSGVDIDEADRLVDYLKTRNRTIGGFSGLMPLPRGYKKPMLVASTDGVGTKLLVAKAAGDLSTIGIDLVGMVVNDLLVCGAKPLFFLDYYATGKLRTADAKQVLDGIFRGCELAGWPLIGGETAELPGLYRNGDFDLAGFGVGIVEAGKQVDGKRVKVGDAIYGFASAGLHSNGYSLARHALIQRGKLKMDTPIAALNNATLRKALLTPTKIYCKLVEKLLKSGADIRAMAHITGGGIPGNLNRVLPKRADAEVQWGSWKPHPIFELIQRTGPVSRDEMLNTFNMGIGYIAVAPEGDAAKIQRAAKAAGEKVAIIGKIVKGTGVVQVIE